MKEIKRLDDVIGSQGDDHRVAIALPAEHCPEGHGRCSIATHGFADDVFSRNLRQLFLNKGDKGGVGKNENPIRGQKADYAVETFLEQTSVAEQMQKLLRLRFRTERPEPGSRPPSHDYSN